MRKMKLWVPVCVLVMAMVLSACGNSATSASDGSKKMKQTLAELKKNVDADDAAGADKKAGELEDSWKKFEDGVKAKNADLYQKIEDPLHAIAAGAKQAKLDKAAMNDAIGKLTAALDETEKLK